MSLPSSRTLSSAAAASAALLLALAADARAADPEAPSSDPALTAPAEARPVLLVQVGSGVVAAAVTVPASMALGAWVGTLSGSTLSALPALLIAAVVPPVAVTLSAWLTGNWGGPERFRLNPAIWVTTGVSVASMVAAGFLGLNANEPGRVALYTAAQAVLLPAAAVGTLQWTAAPPPAQAALSPGEPRLPKVPSVPVVQFAF